MCYDLLIIMTIKIDEEVKKVERNKMGEAKVNEGFKVLIHFFPFLFVLCCNLPSSSALTHPSLPSALCFLAAIAPQCCLCV